LNKSQQPPWQSVSDIPRFPFEDFEQMKAAAAIRSFNIGVDSLAAAKWSQRFNTGFKKAIIASLSLLLVIAGVAAVVAAVLTREYWLLAAAPIQAVVFLDLLLNGLPIAAALVAYAGLTFAAVRAAGYITNSSFRRALLSDEGLFLEAYARGACTLRNNQTKMVYSA
jgi:hypothetical protein